MSESLWPFIIPSLVIEGAEALSQAVRAALDIVCVRYYWEGVKHGFVAACVLWIVLKLAVLLFSADTRREVRISIVVALLGLALWAGGRAGAVKLPLISPKKAPARPWQPFKRVRNGRAINTRVGDLDSVHGEKGLACERS